MQQLLPVAGGLGGEEFGSGTHLRYVVRGLMVLRHCRLPAGLYEEAVQVKNRWQYCYDHVKERQRMS
jgi:hypothetical protein